METLLSPFEPIFSDFARSVQVSCLVCSPYITFEPIKQFVSTLQERNLTQTLRLELLTDLSAKSLSEGSTDVNALIYLANAFPQSKITTLPNLHAKVYIADTDSAIVTSANFTQGGSLRNWEYGIRIYDQSIVANIISDMKAYTNLGSLVSVENLYRLQQKVQLLHDAIRAEEIAHKTMQRELRRDLERELRAVQESESMLEEEIIRLRVENESIHAIFAKTILYLLEKRGPLQTTEMNGELQRLHPDLCDSTLDRIIDGVSYGKKWKHQVRTSQVGLRRTNRIALNPETKKWYLLTKVARD